MKTSTRIVLTATLTGLLTACGGGGSTVPTSQAMPTPTPATPPGTQPEPVINAPRTRELTGGATPTETGMEQETRGRAILQRADSLYATDILATTDNAQIPTLVIRSLCANASCTVTATVAGQTLSDSVGINDLSVAGTPTPELTKHGITLSSYQDTELVSYGAFMDHSGFAIQGESYVVEGINVTGNYGIAGGDLTGSRPAEVSASWQGLMVGATRAFGDDAEILQGDATLSWTTANGGQLGAVFSEIKNIDLNRAHTTERLQFDNIPVSATGTFQQRDGDNRIEGALYGPNHVEAAGILQGADLIGAFGAKMQ